MDSTALSEVSTCVADVLGMTREEADPDTLLSELGLESFTAVRLRRRLREEAGLDLPLTAFLGDATIRSITASMPDTATSATEPRGDAFPLTPIQLAYLVGRDPRFPLGGVATFFYHEYDRRPPGDPEEDLRRLEAAWNRLVGHHPMLRMVIDADVRQRVLPSVSRYRIPITDLRAATPTAAEEVAAELRSVCSHQLLPTDTGPLFDIRAALLPDGRTRLYLGVDVLALDLGCWFQLMHEWGTLVADPTAVLPTPAVTFADFVRNRQTAPAEAQRRVRDQEYWAARVPDLPPGPALPWACLPEEIRTPRFVRHAAELDALQWAALRAAAARRGLSPSGVLLAACGLVLARWGADAPFCLNTTLFDRRDATADDPDGLEYVVGDFTSTVLVEAGGPDLAAWSGFGGHAAAVNRQFWSDLEHRSVSGIEALRQHGSRSDLTPAYPVVFTSGVGLSGTDGSPAAWLGEDVFGVSQTPQVLMDHIVWDEDSRLRMAWDVVDGALPDGFVDAMAAAHTTLLRRLATDDAAWSDRSLGWVPSFQPDEPLTCTPFDDAGPLLDDPARTTAIRVPRRPALLGTGQVVTHGELAARASRTADVLATLGIGPDDLVAVAVDKSPQQITAVLGVSAAGAGYVPVEPSWPAARVASLCAQARVRHALVGSEVDTCWPSDVTVHRLAADGTLNAGPAADRAAEPVRPAVEDLAYVIFTSGSTGRPKGVAIEHRAVRTTLDDLADRFPLADVDRVLALSAFSFDLSVYDIYSVLGAGGALVVPDAHRQRDPGHWLDLMVEHGVTIWNTAPALMEMLVEYAEVDPELTRKALRPLRLVLLSADWIPVTLPDRIRALAPQAQVVSLGGATEGSIWSICFPIGEVRPEWTSIPYGRALRGQSFHVLDADGRPCPVGTQGELHIGGSGLAAGYIGDHAQTAERFVEHDVLGRLYRTGDLGRWRMDGTIEFLGRVDRQVKIRGHRIELGEVESVLDRAPGLRKAVGMSMPGPDQRPRLVAFVVANDATAPPAEDGLINLLQQSLPEFMVPSRFVWLTEFPTTANGKVDYAALRNPYGSTVLDVPAPLPRTARRADMPPATAVSTPAGGVGGWFEAILDEAAACGLGVSLTITQGRLSPRDALVEAGQLSARAHEHARAHEIRLTERLTRAGLLEITLGATPAEADADPVYPSGRLRPARVRPAPAPVAASDGPSPRLGDVADAGQPDPDVVRAISAVMGDLLNTPIHEGTPFFRLGATSLTLVLAHKRLAAELDAELAVVDLFARPTVRDLATLISQRRAGHQRPAPTAAPPQESVQRPARPDRRTARRMAAEVAG